MGFADTEPDQSIAIVQDRHERRLRFCAFPGCGRCDICRSCCCCCCTCCCCCCGCCKADRSRLFAVESEAAACAAAGAAAFAAAPCALALELPPTAAGRRSSASDSTGTSSWSSHRSVRSALERNDRHCPSQPQDVRQTSRPGSRESLQVSASLQPARCGFQPGASVTSGSRCASHHSASHNVPWTMVGAGIGRHQHLLNATVRRDLMLWLSEQGTRAEQSRALVYHLHTPWT